MDSGPKLVNVPTLTEGEWSRHSDLNRGPAVYETAALPLSYVGPARKHSRTRLGIQSGRPVAPDLLTVRVEGTGGCQPGAPGHGSRGSVLRVDVRLDRR